LIERFVRAQSDETLQAIVDDRLTDAELEEMLYEFQSTEASQ
jgi:hypothetical protein